MATIASPRTQSPASTPRIASPSLEGTPTSSVRPSIDLNRSASPNPSTSINQAQRRNRAALRDYYNLKAKPTNASGTDLSSSARSASIKSASSESIATSNATLTNEGLTTSSLTAQLDEPDFEADKWISEHLKTSGLRDILRTEATLVSEIRNLDGERKALVYDNYSKLIKAVGTIGEMQQGMKRADQGGKGGLDGIEALNERLESLTATAKEIVGEKRPKSGEEAKKRRHIREENKKRELVKWVIGAPSRLSEKIQEGNLEEAEKEWEIVQGYLTRWKDVKGVDEVKKNCEEVMNSTVNNMSEEDSE